MSILVNREILGKREFVGEIVYDFVGRGEFAYDAEYVKRAKKNGELGISELLPLGIQAYSSNEFDPFFKGLLPEGRVISNLSMLYQVPQSNYLAMLEQLGCESIGALTFVSSEADPNDYRPSYEPINAGVLADLIADPVHAATITASSTRLSLAGAQSKVAWYLIPEISADSASSKDWQIPRGTAPSSHIIKVSRRGEESTALNELACSLLAKACGIEIAQVATLPEIPGAIAVVRYDRVWTKEEGASKPERLMRLHQEDFCQALGLPPYFKYQPSGVSANYPAMMANLVRSACENPQRDMCELVKRILFCFAVGNSDAHLKNFSLLYNQKWTARRLAPFYDVTCIPLTGYSTAMPFDVGKHRKLEDITARDLVLLALEMDINLDVFDAAVKEILSAFESLDFQTIDNQEAQMVDKILDNSIPRIKVLKEFAG